MKYLFMSDACESIGLATHLTLRGNEVLFYCRNLKEKIDNKIVQFGPNPVQHYEWADVIFFDDINFGDLPKKLRDKFPEKIVMGGCDLADKLEEDRDFGARMFNLYGIRTPPTMDFSKAEAIKHMMKNPKEYVMKLPIKSKNGVLVAKDKTSQDLIEFMHAMHYDKEVCLQEKIKGIEVAVTGFFNGEKFIEPIVINYEHKNFGNDNTGLKTGEMGTVFYYHTKKCKLYRDTLGKIESLFKGKYFGFIDLNTITNTSGSYVLEITSRPGYPICDGISTSMDHDWEMFFELVKKGDATELLPIGKFNVVVVLALTHPFESVQNYMDVPIVGIQDSEMMQAFVPTSVYFDSLYRTKGKYIGTITGSGNSIRSAQEEAYRLMIKANTPQIFYYRTDIGDQTIDQDKYLRGQRII
jgi:phosphoribosylamine--glycine ligase